MITADDLVRREICHCASSLISTLAAAAYSIPSKRHGMVDPIQELGALAEQASELAAPIDDWEEAAIQEGWSHHENSWRGFFNSDGRVSPSFVDPKTPAGAWQALCDHYNIDPYQWEVYEHWIVTDWLADKLETHGEKVDKDFAGMCIWARTTTGQMIAADHVIKAITAEVNAA